VIRANGLKLHGAAYRRRPGVLNELSALASFLA
jgi:hypothetical protein